MEAVFRRKLSSRPTVMYDSSLHYTVTLSFFRFGGFGFRKHMLAVRWIEDSRILLYTVCSLGSAVKCDFVVHSIAGAHLHSLQATNGYFICMYSMHLLIFIILGLWPLAVFVIA